MTDLRRRIPSVDTLLASDPFAPLLDAHGRPRVTESLRRVQEAVRERLAAGSSGSEPPESWALDDPEWYAGRVDEQLADAGRPSLRGVINATGVVLHTNLGRAPLAEGARQAMLDAADYVTLEYDPETGSRGSRHDHCVGLLRDLTGAEAALVVNNNAAAVVLALNTLADGRDALISRGELVEIGGSFRIPEIMERSGARMREVGSTNRTHLQDYRDGLSGDVAMILKVHRSNFRVEGFTKDVDTSDLADLAREAGVPLVHDLGSGALIDFTDLGLPAETTAGEALRSGAEVVTLSGDKLLGGPQAGIILGRTELLGRMQANPLYRALRCDKLTLAALAATLGLYRDGRALAEIPVLRMLAAAPAALRERAEALVRALMRDGVDAVAVEAEGAVGGGAYPGVALPGTAVAVACPRGADALARRLREGDPAVVGRVREDRLLLDPRTVPPQRDGAVVRAVVEAMRAEAEVAAGASPERDG